MNWSSIRIEKAVLIRLQHYRIRLERSISTFPARYPAEMRNKRLSLGEALGFLLDREEVEQRRKDRHDKGRNGRKQAPPDTVTHPAGSEPVTKADGRDGVDTTLEP